MKRWLLLLGLVLTSGCIGESAERWRNWYPGRRSIAYPGQWPESWRPVSAKDCTDCKGVGYVLGLDAEGRFQNCVCEVCGGDGR